MGRSRLSLIVANWLVEDQSYLARGTDPTWVGKFELTSVFGQTLTVEEFQGIHAVSLDGERVFVQNMTDQNTKSLDAWLEELGAPTMRAVYDALNYAEEMEVQELDENPLAEIDHRMLGWAY